MLLFTFDVLLKDVDVSQQHCTLGKAVIERRIRFSKIVGQMCYLAKQNQRIYGFIRQLPQSTAGTKTINEHRTVLMKL